MNQKLQRLYAQSVSGERSGDLFRDGIIASRYDHDVSQVFGTDLEQYKANIDFLLDLTTYRPTDMVVDLGCGTGISTLRLLERNPGRVIGLDFAEPMLRQAREKLKSRDNVEFKVCSAEELSDVVDSADKVVSADVFQYISNPDKVLQRIYRVLNPDGEYLFNVRVKAPKEQSGYFHLFRAIERAMSEELGEEVKLPELEGLEPKYERTDLETLATRNGFAIARYEERPIIYEEKHLRAIHQQSLDGMTPELEKTFGKEVTARIVQRVQDDLTKMYSSDGFVAGKEAYVCLRKAQPPSK